MKKILFLGLVFCVSLAATAQKVYFIYLQTETGSPFYTKLNDKVLSSSSGGYLIIPELKDGDHTIIVGNNNAKVAEAKFSIKINNGDKGFLIRNYENGLSLFDLQTLNIVMPVKAEEKISQSTTKKTDPFTKLLAKAADDSTLLTEPIIAKQEPKKTEEKKQEEAVVQNTNPEKDNAIAAATTETSNEKKAEVKAEDKKIEEVKPLVATTDQSNEVAEVKEVEGYKKSIVTRRSESSTTEGFGLVFLDDVNGVVDTIRLLIPDPKVGISNNKIEPPVSDKKFLDISSEKEPEATDKKITAVKPVCSNIASENDFRELRKNMAAADNDDKMIEEAKKYYTSKCFTSEQIKNLSPLFLSSKGKFNFFQASYIYVSDKENFSSLEKELNEEEYINKFKSIIAN